MEGIFLFLTAEIIASTTLAHLQLKARQKVLRKWWEGSLTMEELKKLKRMPWFRKLWNPTCKVPSYEKKND